MKLSGFGKIIAKTFTDKFSVSRYQPVTNADGTTKMTLQVVDGYEELPCRISFSFIDKPIVASDETNPIFMRVHIFCAPDVDVQKGDYLVAHRLDNGSVIREYEGIANMPFQYVTHLQITMGEAGDA